MRRLARNALTTASGIRRSRSMASTLAATTRTASSTSTGLDMTVT